MNKLLLLCSLLLFCEFSCTTATPPMRGRDRSIETLYDRLEKGGALEHRFDLLMERILPRIALEIRDPRMALINSSYSDSAINFYIVKPEQLRHVVGPVPPGFSSWHEMGDMVEWNFIAVAPNLVFVDDIFFSAFLWSEWVLSSIITDVERNIGSAERFAPIIGSKKKQMAGLYARYKTMLMLIDERNSLRTNMGRWHSNISSYLPPPVQDELFSLSMLLVFGHELAHLRDRSEGRFQDIVQPLFDLLSEKQVREEEIADQIAISAVKRYYLNLVSTRAANMGLTDVKEVPVFETYAVIAIANILRDLYLVEMFDRFRGLRAPEVFVELTRWDNVCSEPSRAYGPVLLEEVSAAYDYGGFPILTESEFIWKREKLLNDVLLSRHSHNFVRSYKLRSIFEDLMPEFRNQAEMELKPFRALLENQPSKATPVFVSIFLEGTGLGVTRSFVEHMFQGAVRFEQGVTCPKDSCIVGFFYKYQGFMELIGPPADVKLIRLVFPTGTQGQREAFGSWCERLLNGVGVTVSSDLRQDLWKLIEKLANCPGARSQSVHGKVVVTIEQLNLSPFTVVWLNGR